MNRDVEYWNRQYQNFGISGGTSDGWLNKYAAQLYAGARILDLGCGAGANLAYLMDRGANVTAADFSKEAVTLVQQRYGCVTVDCFDMREGLPYADAAFDTVISDLSLHYFNWLDTQRIIGEIWRVLRAGGCLIARLHSIQNLETVKAEKIETGYYLVEGYTRRYFTEAEIRSLFRAWKLHRIETTIAERYGKCKHVIEFMFEKT